MEDGYLQTEFHGLNEKDDLVEKPTKPSKSKSIARAFSIFLIISGFSLKIFGSSIIQSPLGQLGYVLKLHQ